MEQASWPRPPHGMGTQLRSHLVIRGRVGGRVGVRVRVRVRVRVGVRVGVMVMVRVGVEARVGGRVAPEVVVVLRALIRLAQTARGDASPGQG